MSSRRTSLREIGDGLNDRSQARDGALDADVFGEVE